MPLLLFYFEDRNSHKNQKTTTTVVAKVAIPAKMYKHVFSIVVCIAFVHDIWPYPHISLA